MTLSTYVTALLLDWGRLYPTAHRTSSINGTRRGGDVLYSEPKSFSIKWLRTIFKKLLDILRTEQ